MRLASLVPRFACNGSVPKSPWALGLVLAGMLVLGLPTRDVRADTILNSGTTTVSTDRNFGQGLFVATTGTATMNVVAGGYATNSYAYVGFNAGSVGTANVSSGTWANSETLTVGYDGTGTLNVTGGYVSNTAFAYLGYNATGVGAATVSSGTWAISGGLIAGFRGGTGTLTVNGGSVTNSFGSLGLEAGSVGTATVSSGTWANSDNLTVGNGGNGTLTVNGGSVTNATGYLGSNAGSVGTANVSSGTWANSGNLTVGNSGTGTLTMSGGLVTVGGTLSQGGAGTINLNSGGTLQIGVGGAGGVLGVSTLVNNGTLIFNRSDASTYSGIISGTGAVTKQGAGTLTLDGNNSYAGGTTIRSGEVAVTAGGVISHGSASLIIGQSSGDSGALNVTGGSVTNATGYLGSNAGSVGTATVSSGTWANSGVLYVGYDGTGTLTVNGGSVASSAGIIGRNAGGVGTATVSSGTWANNGNLYVGDSGTGTLNVNGGYVSNGNGYLGAFDSVGTATVSSGTWAISGSLYLGFIGDGTGTLNLNGGLVSVADLISTNFGGGSYNTINLNSGGTLQIGVGGNTGGLHVDALTNNGRLIFDRSNASYYWGVISGKGSVTKQGAGTLTLGGNNSYTGETWIRGGVLQVGDGGTTGSIAGDVDNNSTLIFNRSDASIYSGVISGNGTVTKQGVGTLTLSGNNSYTGGTTISGGVLALGSANAVGTSGAITFGGGTLQYSASNTTDYSSRFSTAAGEAYKIDTNGQNVTLASPLASSGGTLTKQGAGTLTLFGNNSYTGDTTISGGVLQVGAGGTTGSIAGNVVNNSTLIFNRSDTPTYAGIISGTGSVTKQGSGTLTLSGNNSYTGGTAISDGVLQVGDGGTTGAIAGNVVNNSSLVFNRSDASTHSNFISGTGTVQNAGTGTITLTGQTSFTNGLVTAAGRLIVGNASSLNGFSTTGNLTAASGATLELKSRGLAYVNGLSTLTGGTILAANGISLGAGANVVGTGTISGDVSAVYGSWIEADGGKLTVGKTSSYVGFASDGRLYTNANEVELLDRNLAVLGSLTQLGDGSAGGTLRAANGMLLEQGKNLVGRGTVYGNFVNQGDVYGDGSAAGQVIVFAAGSTVSGIGSFENVVFDGTYSPGNSPAITNLTNGQFSSASSLLIELGGTQPGTQYDRVVDSGVLTLLGGTLNVALYNGFMPSLGDSFEILQYGSLSGDFGTVIYPTLSDGFSWARTTSATAMTITVVPEPSTYAMALAGLACGCWRMMRRRRLRQDTSLAA